MSRPDLLPGVEPEDHRVEAFRKFIASIDRRNAKLGVEASRELRRFGISVCAVTPREPSSGVRHP